MTGGINTPPTLKALQKRDASPISCDMYPAPRDSQMLVVYLWLQERLIIPNVGTLSRPH